MEDTKEKVEALSFVLKELLQQVDMFTQPLTKEDFDLLEKAKKGLENKISKNMSALPLIMAFGGNYDSTEDEMKLKTLNLLIELIKTRIEFREKMNEQIKRNANLKEALKLFDI